MKKEIIICFIALMLVCSSIGHTIMSSFPGWSCLEDRSDDIVIARCTQTPLDLDKDDPSFLSDVDVACVLKGTNGLGPKRLWSLYRPHQDEYYLILSTFHDGSYQALEEFRIVPLGYHFSTNMIAKKPLDEQVKVLLKSRLNRLNQQLKLEEEEKKRLEAAFH